MIGKLHSDTEQIMVIIMSIVSWVVIKATTYGLAVSVTSRPNRQMRYLNQTGEFLIQYLRLLMSAITCH